jgi:hypothetical protein
MAVTATTGNRYKEALINGEIDLDNDSIKVLLMRSGFVFDKQEHHELINLKTVNAGVQIDVDEPTGKFTRASGSFVTDGFVVGNEITGANFANGGNNAAFIIDTVSATEIVVVDNTGMVTETGSGDETLTSDDELATGNGYTQDTKTTGTTTVALDNPSNYANMTFPTVTWSASGGSIGPSPGAILYDDTHADDVIIGYIDFGAEQTATDGTTFDIQNGEIREL